MNLDSKTDRQFWLTSGLDPRTVVVHSRPVSERDRVEIGFWKDGHSAVMSRRYVGRLLSRTNLPLPKHGSDQIVRVVLNLELGSVTKDVRELRPRL